MSSRLRESARRRLFWAGSTRVAQVLAWLALLVTTGWLVRAEALRPETPPGVRAFTDLVYREVDGRRLRLDVFVPVDRERATGRGRPAVLAIHGGGWRGGSKTDLSRPDTGWKLENLVRQGLIVVAIDYRLSAPGKPSWPGNLDDVREAVRWVRRHSADFGIDPDRLAVLGASAGGHLALMLGMTPSDRLAQVAAVIDFYGPTDLRALSASRTPADRAIELLMGGPVTMGTPAYDTASPLLHVASGGPPVLIVHGTDDFLVPVEQSRSLDEALERAGVPHRLITIADARHGFGLKSSTRDLVPDILDFLDAAWGHADASARQHFGFKANSW